MGLGLWMLYQIPNAANNRKHFGGSGFALSKWFDPTSIGLNAKTTIYTGFVAVLANLVVAIVATLILRAMRAPEGVDVTKPDDYFADEGEPRVTAGRTDKVAEPVPTG